MWTKAQTESNDLAAPQPSPKSSHPVGGAPVALIGASLKIKGKLSGSEDLRVEGRVDGEIRLKDHCVTVGAGGRVKGDIHSKTIYVEGEVEGNLLGSDEVVIRSSGNVKGNTVAPRVTLENGSKFKGSIDMQGPEEAAKAPPRAAQAKGKQQRPLTHQTELAHATGASAAKGGS